jgi:hypothetical protein
MRVIRFIRSIVIVSLLPCAACRNPPDGLDASLRLNEIQLKGTHNSYHRRPAFPLVREHDYEQPPIGEQLELHDVRVFELDVHLDREEGFRVYHLPVIDARSTCRRLVDCLEQMKTWSDRHPAHVPLFIWIEPKDDVDVGRRIDDFDQLEAEILSVWPRDRLITPNLVRGDSESLRAAIDSKGWPFVDEVRGRAMFFLLDTGAHRSRYLRGRTDVDALAGRVLFAAARPEEVDLPFAVVAKINDPRSRHVAPALARGWIIGSNVGRASRSDAENHRRLEAGLRAGVQLLKGDFPAPVDGRAHWFRTPNGRDAWPNPVTARED